MSYLILQIILCLIVALVFGFILGFLACWWFGKRGGDSGLAARVDSLERDSRPGAGGSPPRGGAVGLAGGLGAADGESWSPVGHPVEDIEGIGRGFGNRLRGIGISTTLDLLNRCSSEAGRSEVSSKTEIESVLLQKCAYMADLMRIPGLTGQDAELMEACGVRSCADLATRGAQDLGSQMASYNSEHRIAPKAADRTDLADWIAKAKEMPNK